MDGLQDGARQVDEGTTQQAQGASAQVSGGECAAVGGAGGGKTAAAEEGVAQARADYEAALKERDERIDALEGESAGALRKEMDELRRRGDEERVGFELQLAGARNVKAARALLSDHDNDIEKLGAAEPRLSRRLPPRRRPARRGCRARAPPGPTSPRR